MLIRFSVQNFLSIRDRQTLDFTAVKTCKERMDDNTFEAGGQRLLKSIALYGANASGKSNIMTAFTFLRGMILNSAKDRQSPDEIPTIPFLFRDSTSNVPSCFEIEFILGDNGYRYGFEVTRAAVISEWLFRKPFPKNKETTLFRRALNNGEDTIDVTSEFKAAESVVVHTRENGLFLSTCDLLAIKEVKPMIHLFAKSITAVSGERISPGFSSQCVMDGSLKKDILGFLQAADTCIQDLSINELKQDADGMEIGSPRRARSRLEIKSHHHMYSENDDVCGEMQLPFVFESLGTQKLFALAGPIIDTLRNGSVLFIDEMDSRIHPVLTRNIVRLFNSTKSNPKNAQLIFNTHDTNLLSFKTYDPATERDELFFRRDQIYFAEKDKTESTHVYSLIEFKNEDGLTIRNDASYEKDYLGGRYGAVPFIGAFPFVEESQ